MKHLVLAGQSVDVVTRRRIGGIGSGPVASSGKPLAAAVEHKLMLAAQIQLNLVELNGKFLFNLGSVEAALQIRNSAGLPRRTLFRLEFRAEQWHHALIKTKTKTDPTRNPNKTNNLCKKKKSASNDGIRERDTTDLVSLFTDSVTKTTPVPSNVNNVIILLCMHQLYTIARTFMICYYLKIKTTVQGRFG